MPPAGLPASAPLPTASRGGSARCVVVVPRPRPAQPAGPRYRNARRAPLPRSEQVRGAALPRLPFPRPPAGLRRRQVGQVPLLRTGSGREPPLSSARLGPSLPTGRRGGSDPPPPESRSPPGLLLLLLPLRSLVLLLLLHSAAPPPPRRLRGSPAGAVERLRLPT